MNLSHPYRSLWIAGMAIAVVLIIVGQDVVFMINSSPFPVSLFKLGIMMAVLVVLSGWSHYIFRGYPLNKVMSQLHLWTTLISLLWLSIHCIALAGLIDLQWESTDVVAGSIGLVGLGLTIHLLNMAITFLTSKMSRRQ